MGKLGVKWAGSRMYTKLATIKIHQFPVVAKEFFTKLLEKNWLSYDCKSVRR